MLDEESSSAPPPTKQPSSKSPLPPALNAALTTTAPEADQSGSKLTTYFTKSQFALALIIQRSTPEGVSMSDYCQQLRKNIRQHHPVPSDAHRYVDTWKFWKDQYTSIYEEKKTLEDKVHILEETIRTQRSTVTPDMDDEAGLSHNGKRLALFEEAQEILDVQQEGLSAAEATILRLCRYALQIGQQRIHLETTVKEPGTPEHLNNLVKSSNQLLRLLEVAIDDCTTPLWSLKCSDDTRIIRFLHQLMHQIVLSFQTCFNALNELCLTIQGRSMKHEIVYHLAMFFKKALDNLHTACTLQGEAEVESKRKSPSKRLKTDEEYAVNKYLSQALILVTQMEWKVEKAGHSDILEGMLFSILDHTGRLVSNAVFNEHVATSKKVANITLGGPEPLPGAAKLEAQYIIPILRAALGGDASRKEFLARVLCNGRGGVKDQTQGACQQSSTGDGLDLVTSARKRLQETLIKCAVGGNELDSLVLPPQPDGLDYWSVPTSCGEEYGPEWVLESVWAVVGWELAIPFELG